MLTLGQAAKHTGVSKTAISRAIKSGRLSATRSAAGDYQIDPAELFRVYPVTVNLNTQTEQTATPQDASPLQAQLAMMREERERERQQMQATIDDLRRRLDAEGEERRQLLRLLPPPAKPAQDSPASPAQARAWWEPTPAALGCLAALLVVGCAFGAWWVWGKPSP